LFLQKTNLFPSSIEKIYLDDRPFYVKRDDLIDPYLSGNKYRKLYTLLQTQKDNIQKIISYGGTQSNAMLAVAALCKIKEWEFEYYTKSLHVSENEDSNFYKAINLGMKHRVLDDALYKDFIASLTFFDDEKTYLLHQGGADKQVKDGIDVLAHEIRESGSHVKAVATPSGTGTTALYLALALPEYKVYTTPCVGNKEYLLTQMATLHEVPANLVILDSEKKYHFAKPYKEFYEIYEKLKKVGIEFDLIYSPKLWKLLLEQTDEEIIYIHSGGTTGNKTMLERYKYKGLVSI
jgi:1-aminocyclopropane-1-carboxylate deaminase